MRNFSMIAICITAGMLVCACSPKPEEVSRIADPSVGLDAVLVRPATDATVGTVDWVYVLPHGSRVMGRPLFIADRVEPDLSLRWASSTHLIIGAAAARIFRYEKVHLFKGERPVAVEIEAKIARAIAP